MEQATNAQIAYAQALLRELGYDLDDYPLSEMSKQEVSKLIVISKTNSAGEEVENMDEYHPCKKPDPTARKAIGNIMRLVRAQNKNKYNARKTTVCGHEFDSRREAEIYLDLLSRKQHGEILRIGFQPQYTLLEGFRDNMGKKQRPITYTADFFVAYVDGRNEVIEVKGVRTRDYLLRKKLFLYKMRKENIVFREVR